MALISETAGCKVGWATYDNEAEAHARSTEVAEQRDRKLAQGYDFGYLWPGTITRRFDAELDRDVWTVVLP